MDCQDKLDDQGISTGLKSYTYTERHLRGDPKVAFDPATLGIGMRTVDDFNKGQTETTKHTFPVYVFREQKHYLLMHLLY